MDKTSVMTLRLPSAVAQGVERLARRFGHKPAQVGARLVEEGVRRRDFPQIDFRDTAGGRVAYVAGTRLAVYWVAQSIRNGASAAEFARQHELPQERILGALAYAAAYRKEMLADAADAEANRKWLETQQTPAVFVREKSGKTNGKRGARG